MLLLSLAGLLLSVRAAFRELLGLPRWLSGIKNLPANAGDTGSIPGLGRSPRGGNGNPLQYFCLDNPMDREVWQAIVHEVAKSWTRPKHPAYLPYMQSTSRETLGWKKHKLESRLPEKCQ